MSCSLGGDMPEHEVPPVGHWAAAAPAPRRPPGRRAATLEEQVEPPAAHERFHDHVFGVDELRGDIMMFKN